MSSADEAPALFGLDLDVEAPYPGPKSRTTDPATSHAAAAVVRARAGTARVVLLEAYGAAPTPITDERAAEWARLSPASEYATRCSELRAMGLLAFTGEAERGRSGAPRALSVITDEGRAVLRRRAHALGDGR